MNLTASALSKKWTLLQISQRAVDNGTIGRFGAIDEYGGRQ